MAFGLNRPRRSDAARVKRPVSPADTTDTSLNLVALPGPNLQDTIAKRGVGEIAHVSEKETRASAPPKGARRSLCVTGILKAGLENLFCNTSYIIIIFMWSFTDLQRGWLYWHHRLLSSAVIVNPFRWPGKRDLWSRRAGGRSRRSAPSRAVGLLRSEGNGL